MEPFVICSGSTGLSVELAEQWNRLDLPLLIAGETALSASPKRTVIQELGTTSRDQPRLGELLRRASQLSSAPWLLLVHPQLHLGPLALQRLQQLCRPDTPRRLVLGRAWRLPAACFEQLPMDPSAREQVIETLLCGQARLDPPEQCSWVLLPRDCLQQLPAELSCCPVQAAPWLAGRAQWLGWPVLEATPAITTVRPETDDQAEVDQGSAPWSCREASGVVLPNRAGMPRLSLLVAAPEEQCQRVREALSRDAPLPWEVVMEPLRAEEARDPWRGWSRALERAQGDLIWPLAGVAPPLPLVTAVLRAFERPVVDLLQLSARIGGQNQVLAPGRRPAPGCLVLQAAWLRRLGGFPGDGPGSGLARLLQQAELRGGRCLQLPLAMAV